MRSDCHVYYIVLMTCPLIFYHSVTRIARPGKTNLISSNNHLDSESSVPPPVPLNIFVWGHTQASLLNLTVWLELQILLSRQVGVDKGILAPNLSNNY